MANCNIGLHNTIYNILNNKPWFGYKPGDSIIKIFDSPNNKINFETSIGAAKSTANYINKMINDEYPNIGKLLYHRHDINGRGEILIAPTDKQLEYINATDENKKQLRLAVEHENYQKKQGNWDVNDEGDIIVKYSINNSNNQSLTEGLQWLKQIMPDVEPKLVDGLIDNIANGSYDIINDLITLSKDFANKGVVKEEAFHRWWEKMTPNREEVSNILNQKIENGEIRKNCK